MAKNRNNTAKDCKNVKSTKDCKGQKSEDVE